MRYVFDLDNTICDTKQNSDGTWDYLDAKPLPGRVEKVNELFNSGNYIIVETARGNSSKKNWYEKTYQQLVSFGLKFHELRTGVKYIADVYIDDKAVNSEDFFGSNNYLKQESGGKTTVILVNRVFKEATDERAAKLVDEINFIENIPDSFKQYFPKITYSRESENKAYYEMEHYNLPTLRRLILSNQISRDEVLYWADKITGVSMDFYNYQRIDIPSNYFEKMHTSRITNRLTELSRKSDWFQNILREKHVTINGIEYKNITTLLDTILSKQVIDSVQPEFVGRWSHSDLHFSNVLIDRTNDTFVMIDPRGYDFCDYYYDFGKMWHSVNGKYEMISSREFLLDEDSFQLNNNAAFNLLNSLKPGVLDIFNKYSNEPASDVLRKTRWNEVIHFCSLIPFLLDFDGKDERAKVAYYVSLQLLNDYYNDYLG